MPTDRSFTDQTGFLIRERRIELWDAESDFEQAGPRAGVPVPQSRSAMALKAMGVQDADTTIEVRTQRGGEPSIEGGLNSTIGRVQDFGASYVMRPSTSADWQGWDPPRNVSKFEYVAWTDGSINLKYLHDAHAVALDDGTVLCAVDIRDDGLTNPYGVTVFVRDWDTGVWARFNVTGQATAPTQAFKPVLLALPSGRVQLYHLLEDTLAGVTLLRGWYSDDQGATWNYMGDGLIREDIAVPIYRMRIAHRSGQVLLMMLGEGDDPARTAFYQYASKDLGQSFTRVDTYQPDPAGVGLGNDPGHLDISIVPNGFLVTYVGGQEGVASTAAPNTPLSAVLLGSAYSKISEGTEMPISSIGGTAAYGSGDLAVCADDAGALYAYARSTAGNNEIRPVASFDFGETWSEFGTSGVYAIAMSAAVSTVYARYICAVAVRDRVFLLGNHASTVSVLQDSLACWMLGGYGAVTLPRVYRQVGQAGCSGFDLHWFPLEVPDNMPTTYTVTGAGTFTLPSSGYGLISTSANTKIVDYAAFTTTIAQGIRVSFDLNPLTGGSATTQNRVINLRNGDGASSTYEIEVRISTSQWSLWDMNGGGAATPAQIGATQSLSGRTEFLIEVREGTCAAWAWAVAANGNRTSKTGLSSTTVHAGAPAALRVRWGHVANVTATTAYYDWQIGGGDTVGQAMTPADFPVALEGRLYASTTGRPVYVSHGVSILADGGPTLRGEAWSIATRYDYELRRILDFGSPRLTWRSTSLAQQQIALKFDDGVGEDTYGPGSLFGLAGFNCNIAQIKLYGLDRLGAATLLGTANLCTNLDSLHYARAGGSIRPATATSSGTPYLRRNEVMNATFRLDNTYSYRIRNHSEGRWGTAAAYRIRPTLILEAPSSIATGSGTGGAIIPRDWTILIDLVGTAYSGILVEIQAPSGSIPRPAESYFEIGTLVPGWVAVSGKRPSWGRQTDLEAATELVDARDGTSRARNVAPNRRTISPAYSDGIIQTLLDTSQDPDYVVASSDSSVEAHASYQGTAYTIEGIARELQGSKYPMVYLPRITVGSGLRVINRRAELLLARLVGEISVEAPLGNEFRSEMTRLGRFPLREEV